MADTITERTKARSYKPSMIDRLTDWVQTRPLRPGQVFHTTRSALKKIEARDLARCSREIGMRGAGSERLGIESL